jgi:hypothetical protein
MLEHNDPIESAGPVVQVFLIGKTSILGTVNTPFQATVAPPLETTLSPQIIPESQETDIVDPERRFQMA